MHQLESTGIKIEEEEEEEEKRSGMARDIELKGKPA
jgi:hypothetical protein